MIHQKDGGQIGQTISHYPALWDSASKRDSRKRNKILEKLGEVGPVHRSPMNATQKVVQW